MGTDTIIGFINLKNNPFNCSLNRSWGTKFKTLVYVVVY